MIAIQTIILEAKDQEIAIKDEKMATKDLELATKERELASKEIEIISLKMEMAQREVTYKSIILNYLEMRRDVLRRDMYVFSLSL